LTYQGPGAYRAVWLRRSRRTASPDAVVGDPIAIPESARSALARRP
jgi:hypothetical protein